MNLRRLRIERLPGIRSPFEIATEGPGFFVVFGPNGIGKSSICRAVEALYWEDRGPTHHTSIDADFEIDGEVWRAEREGPRVRWKLDGEVRHPPPLPPSHHRNCFFLSLRDLIDPSPEGPQDVAAEIRRQLSGGFDLDRISADIFGGVGAQHGRREGREFNKAVREVEKAEGEQANLQRRADQLEDLKADLVQADKSRRREAAVDRAIGHAERLEELKGVSEELSSMPASLANLSGNEDERLKKHQGRLEGLEKQKRDLSDQMSVAERKRRETKLDEPIEDVKITEWRNNADELGRVEIALKNEKQNLAGAQDELKAALSAVGEGEFENVELDLADHKKLFEFFRAAENHRTRKVAIEERIRLLERINPPEHDERHLQRLRDAAKALRSWLLAPEPENFLTRLKARRSWVVAAVVLVVAGLALAAFVDPTFALLAAVGVGVGLPVPLLGSRAHSIVTREDARGMFEKSGLDEPEAWDTTAVETCLDDLDGDAATLDAKFQRLRVRDVERQTLGNSLDGLSEAEVELEEKRQHLLDLINLDEIFGDAELFDVAKALDQLRVARGREHNVAGAVRHLEGQHAGLLSKLAGDLEQYGETRPVDAATTEASLNNLTARNTALKEAIAAENGAKEGLINVDYDIDQTSQDIAGIFDDAGLDDNEHGLMTLLNSLPDYMEKTNTVNTLKSQIELDRGELEKQGEADLADLDQTELERLRDDLSSYAQQADGIRDEIAKIKADVEQARRGHSVQDLIETREETRMKLQRRLEEALFAKVGHFLIGGVEQEYEQTQMPRVLERARNLFSAFTHHNYELRLGTGGLMARDLQSRDDQGLEELSDGTRTQLLLAARIAFAEEVEQGKTLPLFLDEALDQSDPARYRAIVQSLGRVVEDEGRQIFYLTSDPADVNRVQGALDEEKCSPPIEIDLGLIRTEAASVTDPNALRVEPRAAIPSPEGATAEAYGVTLGVPALEPARGFSHQHLFYLLREDLGLLHDLLQIGIVRVGQWHTVAQSPLATRLGSHDVSPEEVSLRADLLETFCTLWSQGRGRPVDREAIEGSQAISDRYLDDFAAIANELSGDAEAFLATLRLREDPRLKGVRTKSLEKLDQYLRANEYLDEQPVLTVDELRLKALASPATDALPEGVADRLLNSWWQLGHEKNHPA